MTKHARRVLEIAALALLVAAVALGAVLVSRGTPTKTKPIVSAVAPQQAPAAKVVARAPVPAATKAQDSIPCPPPPGEGVLGTCTPKPVVPLGASTLAPAKVDPPASIPDVSSWQGHPNWSAVKSWQVSHGYTPGGIFKIGEYTIDPDASYNNASLKSLGMFRAGYWFVRRTGCTTEASQIINEAKALGLKVVFLDTEVPEASGYGNCLTPPLKAAGLTVGTYASPGAFPGGSPPNPAWIAAYGPANPPAAPWGGPIKAFQCTDGVFGCVTDVPGIGRGDVSVNYGVTKLGAPTAPLCSRTECYGKFASSGSLGYRKGGVRGGPFKGGSICQHGCDERQFFYWWNHATHATHSHRLWIRYRLQFRYHQLEYVIAHSVPADNVKYQRGERAHALWVAGVLAQRYSNLNAYRKAH